MRARAGSEVADLDFRPMEWPTDLRSWRGGCRGCRPWRPIRPQFRQPLEAVLEDGLMDVLSPSVWLSRTHVGG